MSVGAILPVSALVLFSTDEPVYAIYSALGCLLGIAISPDLDQEAISGIEWRIVKYTLGLGFIWLLVWYPYAIMHKHRGSSHWPVIGTLVRVAYISLLVGIAWFLIGMPEVHLVDGMLYAISGLLASDLLHWLADKV